MKKEIIIPQSAMPKKDPEHPCPCQSRLFKMKEKTGEIAWLVETGQRVEKDQVICEGEVEKKTLEFTAPYDGVLIEKSIDDEEEFNAGDIVGYIETDIELFLISGFLGSGKTTFIQNLLHNGNDVRTGIIVNEFGSISIDGRILEKNDIKMVEINNGSIFCACLKSGFVKTLAAYLSQPIDRLYIESSGMADPSNMSDLLEQLCPLLEKKYKTNRRYQYKGAICIVDAGTFEDLSDCIPVLNSQVIKSGLIVLNKKDTVSKEKLSEVRGMLQKMNSDAYIYETEHAKVPDEVLQQYMKGEMESIGQSNNAVLNRPYGGIITVPELEDVVVIKKYLKSICSKMIRMKGFCMAAQKCYHIDCVADDIQIERFEQIEMDRDKIVLISSSEENCYDWLKEKWIQCVGTEFVFEEE